MLSLAIILSIFVYSVLGFIIALITTKLGWWGKDKWKTVLKGNFRTPVHPRSDLLNGWWTVLLVSIFWPPLCVGMIVGGFLVILIGRLFKKIGNYNKFIHYMVEFIDKFFENRKEK